MKRLWGAVLVALLVAGFAPAAHAATPASKGMALVYGDSITYESRYAIAAEIALHPGWTVATHSFGGTAPCDWISWLDSDLATYQPTVFAIETIGTWTRPCMVDDNGDQLVAGTPEFYAKITADLATIFQTVTDFGAQVVFIKAPPMLDAGWDKRITKISANTTKLAKTVHQVSVSGKPRAAVAEHGKFAFYKPCLATETTEMGCTDGQIAIRTTSGLQRGIHFCPAGLDAGYPYACDSYSSGEVRFGQAIGQVLIKPPKPLLL